VSHLNGTNGAVARVDLLSVRISPVQFFFAGLGEVRAAPLAERNPGG
jgi:hypothetical protein